MTRFPTIACALALAALVAACASSPPVPDWQGNARSAMDRAIGTLRNHLVAQGLRDNTLVFYCGDNGTSS